jgi:GTP-binding protein
MSPKIKAMLASYGRSFLAAATAVYATGNTDLKSIAIAALASTLPVALRAVNPKDPAFGFIAGVIEAELAEYGGLEGRPRIIALNKIDIPDGAAMADMVADTLREKGYEVYPVSAASREGLTNLTYAMARLIQASRASMAKEERTRIILRPTAVDDSGFTVKANEDGSFTVRGAKVVRWVRQTNFKNAEAIGYLADRLAQLGVEKELYKKGAVAGSEVRIGSGENEVVFDWEPTIEAGAEQLAGHLHRRGEDSRLESTWNMPERVEDILSEDEIAKQWEYNVVDPHTPKLSAIIVKEPEDGDDK